MAMQNNYDGKTALIAGSTGLVGHECLKLLLEDDSFGHITSVSRRPLDEVHIVPEKLTTSVFDLNDMEKHDPLFSSCLIFCTLGTTMHKAGSKEAFRRVDYDYPLKMAELGLKHGATHFLVVSAMGANAKSAIFYNRVKGELEEELMKLGYPSLTIVRPSLLLGDRKEWRLGEELGKKFAFLIPGKYKAVHARQVARALIDSAKKGIPGIRILENTEIRKFPV